MLVWMRNQMFNYCVVYYTTFEKKEIIKLGCSNHEIIVQAIYAFVVM